MQTPGPLIAGAELVVFCLFFAAIFEIRFAFYVPGFFFALTFVAYFFLAAWLANWKCPRCGQAFFRGAFYRSILFGGRCFHCELPKWCVSETGEIISRPKFPFGWAMADQRASFTVLPGPAERFMASMMLALLMVVVILAGLFDEVRGWTVNEAGENPWAATNESGERQAEIIRLGLTMMRCRRRWIVGR